MANKNWHLKTWHVARGATSRRCSACGGWIGNQQHYWGRQRDPEQLKCFACAVTTDPDSWTDAEVVMTSHYGGSR